MLWATPSWFGTVGSSVSAPASVSSFTSSSISADRAGWSAVRLDAVDLNKAFTAQALAGRDAVDLDADRVNKMRRSGHARLLTGDARLASAHGVRCPLELVQI